MKVYLHYVESCTPKLKAFGSRSGALKFANKFEKKYLGNEDYWIDYLVMGIIEPLDNYYAKFLKGVKHGHATRNK